MQGGLTWSLLSVLEVLPPPPKEAQAHPAQVPCPQLCLSCPNARPAWHTLSPCCEPPIFWVVQDQLGLERAPMGHQ